MNIINPIQQIQPIKIDTQITKNSNKANVGGISFGDFLNNAIQNVNNLQVNSEKLNNALAIGKTDNIQQVMIASEKADMALQYTLQIRNKVLDAYHSIMSMPI